MVDSVLLINSEGVTWVTGTTTASRMGQTRSDLSRSSTATSGRVKPNTREKDRRLCREKKKPQREQINRNPMKSKVLSCLGRRKRDSSPSEAEFGYGNAADPSGTPRGRREGKLPRDEVVSASGEHPVAAPCCFESSPRQSDGNTRASQLVVSRELAAGSSDESGLERRSGEANSADCEEPRPEREDNASDLPSRAMEDQPLGEISQDRIVPETRTNLNLTPLLTSDPDTDQTLYPDPHSDGGTITDEHSEANMTKTDEENNCCPAETGDSDQSSPGGQSFPGTIPKLIITRDPSPSRSQRETELGTDSCLDPHADEEFPCSDSGCGGSPAATRIPRKLSSSSLCLSSASSFDESEDDFTGSDVESSGRSPINPDDGPGVRP